MTEGPRGTPGGKARLRPPGADEKSPIESRRRSAWVLPAALALVGLTLVVVLAGLVTEHERSPQQPNQVPSRLQETMPDRAAGERAEAEHALQSYLRARGSLVLRNAKLWGSKLWNQAAVEARAGDRLFGLRAFAEAKASYARALQAVEKLVEERPARLAAALKAAELALANDDGGAASVQFELALSMDPANEQARLGLMRARVRREVLALLAQGKQAEAAAKLEDARRAYGKALELDEGYAPARSALSRVSAALNELAFAAAMSQALAAIDKGRFDEAGGALAKAARLHPRDRIVEDAKKRLGLARMQARLTALRRDAAARVKLEDWKGARALYQQALQLAPHVSFAREGLDRARERIGLHERLDSYLAAPERLYSRAPLEAAEQLLKAIGEVPAQEPRLAAKLASLRLAVSAAIEPVPVTLRSDGRTEVVIYHVGSLGRFEEERLQLRPGDYTIVGSRPGYRDVQRNFSVRPGTALPPLLIRCEEPI